VGHNVTCFLWGLALHVPTVKVGKERGSVRRLGAVLAATLRTFMQRTSHPYLGPITSYPVRLFFLFCKISSDNCRDNAVKWTTSTSVAVVTHDRISVLQDAALLPRNIGSSKELVISLDSLRTRSLNFILFCRISVKVFVLQN